MRTLPPRHGTFHQFSNLILLLGILVVCISNLASAKVYDPYRTRDYESLSTESIRQLVELDPPEWTSVQEGHLGKLLIPRASGSENNTLVQNYISSVFKKLNWHEERTPFNWKTPIGNVDFTNLIYTFDPSAPRKLVLSAHFDSKWFPEFPQNQFIGATDSAAPCAFLLDLAEALTPLLSARKDRVEKGEGILRDGMDEEIAAETTLQLVFFDGEEAFHDWSDTDSIYGSRYLAQHWETTYPPPPTDSHWPTKRRMSPPPTTLQTIDVLILLDLLGNSHARLHSYFRETDWLFEEMKSADTRLKEEGLVTVDKNEEDWFQGMRLHGGMIGDDHIPFVKRGVSIMHIISNPFPVVWHTLADDASALSMNAMRRWNRILRVFTAEFLSLSPGDARTPTTKAEDKRHSPDELLPSG